MLRWVSIAMPSLIRRPSGPSTGINGVRSPRHAAAAIMIAAVGAPCFPTFAHAGAATPPGTEAIVLMSIVHAAGIRGSIVNSPSADARRIDLSAADLAGDAGAMREAEGHALDNEGYTVTWSNPATGHRGSFVFNGVAPGGCHEFDTRLDAGGQATVGTAVACP